MSVVPEHIVMGALRKTRGEKRHGGDDEREVL
jgi:hypothetical protein